MPRAAARMQTSLDTQSLSSTLLFIPERAELCKGESRKSLEVHKTAVWGAGGGLSWLILIAELFPAGREGANAPYNAV